MFKLWIVILVFSTGAVSCSNGSRETITSDSLSETSPEVSKLSPDSTVISFLKWYRDNEDEVGAIPLVKGGYPDTTTNYSIDNLQTEKYLQKLNSSEFLSKKYIDSLRQYFIYVDKHLQREPENDGPPWGLDADLVMQSQDNTDVWSNLEKAKAVERNMKADRAILKFNFTEYYKARFYLTNYNGKWLIDKIENTFEN